MSGFQNFFVKNWCTFLILVIAFVSLGIGWLPVVSAVVPYLMILIMILIVIDYIILAIRKQLV
ncbi:hypothetical protein EBZ80_06590 [bacterium]|nr:hypothetical protein [bacterium]